MALECVFGATNKKHNSTYTGLHEVATSIVLKENCSVTNPSVLVDLTAAEIFNIHGETLNHAYIPQFKRFYFVDNWTWERGRWRADMSVDVLATWKDEIGASSQYILRASNDSDGTILDTMYPTKNVISERQDSAPSPFGNGSYVIGVIGNTAWNGAVSYYAFSSSEFASLSSYLFGDSGVYDFNEITQDISRETWKSLYNPFQYIASCMYIPMDISANMIGVANVHAGYWTLPIRPQVLSTGLPVQESFSIPWAGTHPDEARGNYVYCNPYTQVDFSFPMFGFTQLPSDIVYKQGGVSGTISVDLVTGEGTLYLGTSNFPYCVLKAQVGIPIKIAQMTTDVMGTAITAASGVAGTVGAALSGDIAGAISTGISAIDSTVRAQVPRLSTMGGAGGFSSLIYPPRAVYRYYKLVDEDNTHLGRPLCAKRRIDTLGDYMLCEGAAVDTTGTFEENKMISNLMNTGFYFE